MASLALAGSTGPGRRRACHQHGAKGGIAGRQAAPPAATANLCAHCEFYGWAPCFVHLHGQSPHTPAPRHTKLHSTLPLAAVVVSVATLDDDRTHEEAVLQGLPRPEYNVTLLTVRGGGRLSGWPGTGLWVGACVWRVYESYICRTCCGSFKHGFESSAGLRCQLWAQCWQLPASLVAV